MLYVLLPIPITKYKMIHNSCTVTLNNDWKNNLVHAILFFLWIRNVFTWNEYLFRNTSIYVSYNICYEVNLWSIFETWTCSMTTPSLLYCWWNIWFNCFRTCTLCYIFMMKRKKIVCSLLGWIHRKLQEGWPASFSIQNHKTHRKTLIRVDEV